MAISINIRERDILKFILDELNDNKFNSKIKFMLGDSERVSDTSMLIRRFTLDDATERMDVVEELNESTYMTDRNPFIIVNVSDLNPQFTALNTIKEVTYDGTVGFLVCEENPKVYMATLWALEEIRSRLIQYHKVIRVEYIDYDNLSSSTKISEDIKLIVTSGGLRREFIDRINGKSYLYFTIPLTIMATNHGEFANQETIYLGVESITESGSTKMFPIEPIEWGWGMGVDTESAQLVNDKDVTFESDSERIKSLPKSKSFAWSCAVQIDFKNALLKKIFNDSRKKNLSSANEVWTIKSEISVYNPTTQAYAVDSTLTFEDSFILTTNKPIESLSKGEKYIFMLGFEPLYNEEVEV
jgi:hypothetical protein